MDSLFKKDGREDTDSFLSPVVSSESGGSELLYLREKKFDLNAVFRLLMERRPFEVCSSEFEIGEESK